MDAITTKMSKKLSEADIFELSTLWTVSGRNPDLRLAISNELNNRISTNKAFSREFFFENHVKGGKVFNIHFIPTSPSFNKYGQFVTAIKYEYSSEEALELTLNCQAKPSLNTQGEVTAQVLSLDNKAELDEVTFNTQDIYKYEFS
jgi:hypothetical protein